MTKKEGKQHNQAKYLQNQTLAGNHMLNSSSHHVMMGTNKVN